MSAPPESDRDRLSRNFAELLQELRVARMLFRQQQRVEIIRSANWMALAGLTCLAGAMIATLGLIVDVVLGDGWALLVGVAAGLGFGLLWFVMPYRRMAHH